jgi:sulfite reductase beta subunit-like hemoprotein
MIEIDAGFLSKFIGRYSLGKDSGNDSSHFLRIKIPGGRLDSKTLREIAGLSEEFGRGYAEITDRQDVQLHWIDPDMALEIFERMYGLGLRTDLCGQAFRETCHGDVRNVVCCPLMGKIGPDFSWLAREINEFFSGNPEYIVLPHKFKIAITACGEDCVKIFANDLSLVWYEDGFVPFVGGGMGASMPGIRFAEKLGIKIPPEGTFEFVKAVIDIHKEFSNTESKAKARFKYLVHTWGIERLRRELERRLGRFEEAELDTPGIGVEHISGIQHDGKNYFTLPVLGGVLDSERLRLIASLSEEYGGGEIRFTTWQNLVFVDVDDVEGLKDELSTYFNLKVPYRAVGCASDFCGKTIVHSKQILSSVAEEMGDLSFAVSGCVNGCACHPLADVGLVGKIKKGKQLYDLFVRGRLVKKDINVDEIPRLLKYLEEGVYEVKA